MAHIDDTVITKHADDAYYVVTNAGRRDRDLAWFADRLEEWNKGEVATRHGPVEHGACPRLSAPSVDCSRA